MSTDAYTQLTIQKFGGPVTSDVYKSFYSTGASATEDWKKGELLYLASGFIKRTAVASGTEKIMDTDEVPFDATSKLFVALEDHDASAVASSVYVSVQEVTDETVFEIQAGASSTTAPLQATFLAGTAYGIWMSATNVYALDVDNSGAKGVLVVVNKDSETNPHSAETAVADTDNTGRFLRVRILRSLLA